MCTLEVMKPAIALVCWLAACGTETVQPAIDAPAGMVTNVSGHLTQSTTWSGTIEITGGTTIDPGVTVTVMPGTFIEIAATAAVGIQGTLDIEGTKAGTVNVQPAGGAAHWLGFDIGSGGKIITHYLVETGGSVNTSGTGSATLIDSVFSHASHDLVVMAGGTLDIEYSAIGVEPPATDTTHCDLHMVGTNLTIKVVHSNISTALYAIMFYAGNNADFTYNNWLSNSIDVAFTPGAVTGNFSNGWFAKSDPPTGVGITAQNMATARLTDAGPR
jgi:hypothetical protein